MTVFGALIVILFSSHSYADSPLHTVHEVSQARMDMKRFNDTLVQNLAREIGEGRTKIIDLASPVFFEMAAALQLHPQPVALLLLTNERAGDDLAELHDLLLEMERVDFGELSGANQIRAENVVLSIKADIFNLKRNQLMFALMESGRLDLVRRAIDDPYFARLSYDSVLLERFVSDVMEDPKTPWPQVGRWVTEEVEEMSPEELETSSIKRVRRAFLERLARDRETLDVIINIARAVFL